MSGERIVVDREALVELRDGITWRCLSAQHATEFVAHGSRVQPTRCSACGDIMRALDDLIEASVRDASEEGS